MDKLALLRQTHPSAQRRLSTLNVTISSVELRTSELRGEEYTVVDIVALRPDIVIRPMGSRVPEYVPGDIHRGALHTFANRPVVLNHPVDSSGNGISANSPEVLESSQFGHVFAPYYDDVRGLVLPSWLNDTLATSVGDEAVSVLSDFRAGTSREISIGAYVYVEEVEGVAPDGTPYGAIWLDYDGDHLAILQRGDLGACSNAAGCGPLLTGAGVGAGVDTSAANRANSIGGLNVNNRWRDRYFRAQGYIKRLSEPNIHGELRDGLLNGEFSKSEIIEKLYSVLSSDEGPNFEWYGWVEDIYIVQGIVLYKVLTNGVDSEASVVLVQRSYSIDANGKITLAEDKQEVIGFTPIIKSATSTATVRAADNSTASATGDLTMNETIRALVDRIIKCSKCPFGEGDKDFLASKDEKFLNGVLVAYNRQANASDSGDGATATATPAPGAPGAPAQPVSAAPVETAPAPTSAPTSTAPAASTGRNITIPFDEWTALQTKITKMEPAANAWEARQAADRARLLAAIKALSPGVNETVYSAWPLDTLSAYHRDLARNSERVNGGDNVVDLRGDYSLLAAEPTSTRPQRESIPSGLAHLRAKSKRANNSAGAGATASAA